MSDMSSYRTNSPISALAMARVAPSGLSGQAEAAAPGGNRHPLSRTKLSAGSAAGHPGPTRATTSHSGPEAGTWGARLGEQGEQGAQARWASAPGAGRESWGLGSQWLQAQEALKRLELIDRQLSSLPVDVLQELTYRRRLNSSAAPNATPPNASPQVPHRPVPCPRFSTPSASPRGWGRAEPWQP